MQIFDLEETENGGAILTVNFTKTELAFFVELGILESLRNGINETQKGIAQREAFEESRSVQETEDAQVYNLPEPEGGLQEER